uniref:Myotubularin-related protein 14 n=1 Tax=Lutzomyia longipalpis TaxID=7200 RepID=A0A1B0CS91_LUTLO
MSVDVQQSDIELLLRTFVTSCYVPTKEENGSKEFNPVEKCTALMKCDYNVMEIPNEDGELCSHYPSRIIIPESEANDNFSDMLRARKRPYNLQKLRETIPIARYARCRSRFPVPVLLYKGKLICRSATISGTPEIYGRSSFDYIWYGYHMDSAEEEAENAAEAQKAKEALLAEAMQDEEAEPESVPRSTSTDWQLCDRVRQQDIKLLKAVDAETIIDFMVEKKKVKFGVNVTSSEKVDKERRYDVFKIMSLPYPGCEFFRVFRDNNFNAEGLIFNWNQTYVDASIHLPPDDQIITQLPIEWAQYKVWDLITITQNYLKLILKYIEEGNSGMLIHCISGWDRTPLFISLVRLSLWADGLIHQSLNPLQMLYFTIAYDWYLFGHNLPDRLKKGEDIFFFCFYFLKYIVHSDYSLLDERAKSKASSTGSSTALWPENDSKLDNLLETENRGSTFSLNSISSCKSNNDECSPPHSPNNSNASNRESAYSPPYKSRTSPVSVPTSNVMQRQHHDSSSSASVGSWQMISGTGSVRSVGSDFSGANNPNANHNDSTATLKANGKQAANELTKCERKN